MKNTDSLTVDPQDSTDRQPRFRLTRRQKALGLLAFAGAGAAAGLGINAKAGQINQQRAAHERQARTHEIGKLSSGERLIVIDGTDTKISLDDAAGLFVSTERDEQKAGKDVSEAVVIVKGKDKDFVLAGHRAETREDKQLTTADVNHLGKGIAIEMWHRQGSEYTDLLDLRERLSTDPVSVADFAKIELGLQDRQDQIPVLTSSRGFVFGVQSPTEIQKTA